jgi:hypothetical protein
MGPIPELITNTGNCDFSISTCPNALNVKETTKNGGILIDNK